MNEAVPSSKPSLPRRIGRIALRVLLALVLLIAAFAAFVYWKSERGMNQRMQVAGEELAIPTSPEAIARGLELANTYGCLECHGSDGGGKHFLDAMPVLDIRTPNLTRGGRTARWSGRDWARSVRHGVRPDGSMVLFMPATDFRMVDAADLGAIVAYMKSLPPVTRDAGRTRPGPVGRRQEGWRQGHRPERVHVGELAGAGSAYRGRALSQGSRRRRPHPRCGVGRAADPAPPRVAP